MNNFIWIDGWWRQQDTIGLATQKVEAFELGTCCPLESIGRTSAPGPVTGRWKGMGVRQRLLSACAPTPPASPLLHLLLEHLAWQWSFGVLFSPTPSHGQGHCPLWVPCQLLNWSEYHPSIALLPSWGHCRDTSSSPPVKCLVQSGHLKDNWRHTWPQDCISGASSFWSHLLCPPQPILCRLEVTTYGSAIPLQSIHLKETKLLIPKGICGLPWWSSGSESACQCGGHGFDPWSGKISHAMEPPSPYSTITEPSLHKRNHRNEKPEHCN